MINRKKNTKKQKCTKENKKFIRHLTKLNKLHVNYLGKKIKLNINCPEFDTKKRSNKKRSNKKRSISRF